MAGSAPVQSLDRAFDLLEILCRSRGGMTIGALSAETGLHKSTVHRLLAGMCARGYVLHDPETSLYRAGMRLCELSSYIVDNLDVVEIARGPMEKLSRITGETVHLVMQEEKNIVYIHKVERGSGTIRMFSRIGMRRPLYCTGVGKAILATLPAAEVEDIWRHSRPRKLTGRTITDLDQLKAQLAEVRRCGYAIDDEENELGIRCVALAIPGPGGRAESAFSISGLAPYMTDERIRRISALALETRADILHDLGLEPVR